MLYTLFISYSLCILFSMHHKMCLKILSFFIQIHLTDYCAVDAYYKTVSYFTQYIQLLSLPLTLNLNILLLIDRLNQYQQTNFQRNIKINFQINLKVNQHLNQILQLKAQNIIKQVIKKMSKHKKPIQISIGQAYDLGFCAVNRTSEFPFTILNPNQKPLSYQFKFTQFIITPSKGVLMPNSINNFKVQFTPKQANVIVGTIVLQVEGQNQRVFRLSAVGKYPYISVSSSDIDFGDVLVSKQVSKQIVLKNNSEVPAQFKLQSILSNQQFNDNFYNFYPERGMVPPKMSYSVKVNYQPHFVDSTTISNAKIICDSGNQISLNLIGYSHKFNVNFSVNSINFGQIKLDSTLNKVLTVFNNSELDTEFQFFVDPNNIFSFNETKGIIQRNSYKKIIIEFRPRNTISYYERVYCLVRNHVLIYVDLIGTCYDLLIKPVPLLQVHVDTFRKRVIQGRISQIELKYIENNILLKLAKKGQIQEDNQKSQQNFYHTTNLIKQHPYVLQKQLFLQNTQNQLITLTQDNIQFGFCDVMTLSGQREIEVTNRLQTKLSIFWISQKKQNLNGEYMTVFNIYPQTAVLKPNIPTKFQITFRPLKSNTFYFQNLQFYAIKSSNKISKKTIQDFQYKELKSNPQSTLLRNVKLNQTIQAKVRQNVETTQVFPPLSGVIRCVGHSFTLNSMPFIPIMKILPSTKITMKPALLNTSVYDSFELVNQSDTPIYFKIGHDINKVFRFFPKMGLIQPKGFAIVAAQFTPLQYKTYISNITVHMNDMPGANTKITFVGTCTQPDIQFENQGRIFFAPTFTGVYTVKKVKVRNLSKTKVKYYIQVPQKYLDQVHFEPNEKQLNPNEFFQLSCYFTPRQKRLYKIKIPVTASEATPSLNGKVGYHSPGSAGILQSQDSQFKNLVKNIWLELNGEGSDGNLQISHEEINFNAVKITQQKKLSFKIKNTADCAFFIDLSLKNNDFDSQNVPSQAQLNSVFNLSFKQGTIPANAQIQVNLTFSPIQVADYNLRLVVNAKQKAPKKIGTMKIKNIQPSMKCQMRIKAQGNYPLLEIIDIRNDTLSVAALWQNFQIQKINQELGCKLDSEEKKYLSVENLTFTETKYLQQRLKNFQWNLGYVSTKIKAKPRKVIITVKNYGGTPVDYCFKFPSDNKVQQQLWADPGEPSQEQAYEKAILQKNIFQIKPKIATLQPGQVKDIQLIYSPTSIDNNRTTGSNNEVHKLKVVFQIQNGKSLVFNLKGTTLGPNEGLITVKKNHYILPQAKIGLLQPIKFPIQINNVGSIKTNYKTEIVYQDQEYSQVLKIQNPSHFLLPGQNLYVYCLYKPLQKKIYNFKVLIHVFDFNKQIQTLHLTLTGNMQKTSLKRQQKVIPFQRSMVSEIGSKVFFSIQEINFEKMQANSTKYRVILLYNMSKQNSLTFQFPTQINLSRQGLTCGDKFIIEPSSGTLETNSFVELKLTLTSSKNPSFYEGEIPCNVVWVQAKFNSQDLQISQKQMTLSSTRESLFLRIKKESVLDQKTLIKKAASKPIWSKKTLFENIFDNIIESTINDPQIDDLIKSIEDEDIELFTQLDGQQPASLDSLLENRGMNEQTNNKSLNDQKKDYSNHDYLILNEQFKQVAQIIMENTFFNIIQETTHQENDLLRVGKKFIQAEHP